MAGNVKIFSRNESLDVILDAIEDDGLVGLHGGRLEVRGRLQELEYLLLNEDEPVNYVTALIDLPDTELGLLCR